MKYLSILFFVFFLSFQLAGQEKRGFDRITLNSGDVYIGEIVVQTPEMVMIKAQDGARYQFQLSEVKSIDKVTPGETAPTVPTQTQIISNSEGNLCGELELSGMIGGAKNAFSGIPAYEGTLAFGSRKAFGKDVFMGIGAGYEMAFHDAGATPIVLVPVFLRLQSTLSSQKTAPVLGVDAGYSFSSSSDFGGGMMVDVMFGMKHRMTYKTAWYFGLTAGANYITADLSETNEMGTYYYRSNTTLLKVGLKLGLQF